MKILFALTIFLSSIELGFAYPNFIGHSYTSCLNCHFNPFGGGPLTDYGRVVGATNIASNVFYPSSWNEEKLAYASGFLFRKPKQNWLRTQINYRGFNLVRNPGSTTAETKQWINMQADARAIIKFGDRDQFLAVSNFGYAPKPVGPENKDQSEWRSREHYLGYRVTPRAGVYVGLMDKVYGIRVIEHIAYSRSLPQVAQNDQSHGLLFHYLGESFETGLNYFVGNLGQDKDLQMKGYSGTIEKTIFELHRIGFSYLASENEYLALNAYAAHARLNLKEGSAILAEVGQTSREAKAKSLKNDSHYALAQTTIRPLRGFYFLTNVEYLKADTKEKPYTVRWGPAIQLFPIQKTEIRLDVYNTRNFSPTSSTKDSWMYLLQTHLWL